MSLRYSKPQIALEIIANALTLAMIIYLAVRWGGIPEEVPTHFSSGEIDAWGGKGLLIIDAAAAVLITAPFSLFAFFIQRLDNLGINGQTNSPAVLKCTRTLLILSRIEITAMFFYSIHCAASLQNMIPMFTPIVLGVFFGTSFICIIRIIRLSKLK